MPIHDEIVFKIKHGEEFIIDELARIMQDAKGVIKKVPMTVGIDKTLTNWAEAKGVDEWEN
jgi:DNA polymerase I-like protein with 3'-5' exonuclease and polymerase domains